MLGAMPMAFAKPDAAAPRNPVFVQQGYATRAIAAAGGGALATCWAS
jgi:hypothetical protein